MIPYSMQISIQSSNNLYFSPARLPKVKRANVTTQSLLRSFELEKSPISHEVHCDGGSDLTLIKRSNFRQIVEVKGQWMNKWSLDSEFGIQRRQMWDKARTAG